MTPPWTLTEAPPKNLQTTTLALHSAWLLRETERKKSLTKTSSLQQFLTLLFMLWLQSKLITRNIFTELVC